MLESNRHDVWALLSPDKLEDTLSQLTDSLCYKLGADHWRIFGIDFSNKNGPYVKLKCAAKEKLDTQKLERYLCDEEEPHLTNHLVEHQKWVIAERAKNSDYWRCTIGGLANDPVEVSGYGDPESFPSTRIECGELNNKDKCRLFWPLHNLEQKLIGFICFYIGEDNVKDRFLLCDIAKYQSDFAHINIAYEHSRALKRKDVAENAYKDLIGLPSVKKTFFETLSLLLGHVGEFIQAYSLNLMEYDADKKRLYTISHWSCDGSTQQHTSDIYIDSIEQEEIQNLMLEDLGISQNEQSELLLRACFKMWEPEHNDVSKYIKNSSLWLAVFDKAYQPHFNALHRWRGSAAREKSETFIQASGKRFYEYFKDYQSYCVQKFSSELHDFAQNQEQDLESLHSRTLDQLCKYTGAEAALLYEPVKSGKVTQARCQSGNDIHNLIDFGVAQGSTSAYLINKCEACLIPKTDEDAGRCLDKSKLDSLSHELGWKQIRSWLYHPLFFEPKIKSTQSDVALIGMIKLLTQNRVIGLFQQQLADKLLAATAIQWCEFQQHHLFAKLPEVMDELMQLSGQDLNNCLIARTKHLVDTYIRRDCHVELMVNNEMGQLILSGASKQTQQMTSVDYIKTVKYLERIFPSNKNYFLIKPKKNAFQRANGKLIALGMHSMVTRIAIHGSQLVRGFLVVTSHNRAFTQWEAEQVYRIVRELSQVIYHEAMRIQWRSDMGVFRHAILAPSQGLVSRAKGFAHLILKHAPDDKAIKKQLRLLKRDEFLVKSWQKFQRVLMDQQIELDRKETDLRECFERWIDRYRDWAAEKGAAIEFEYTAPDQFTFDELSLDIAIGNLLDNAVKYTLENHNIFVRVSTIKYKLVIEISNVSHALSDYQLKQVMRFGERDNMHRNISGQGIGLPLATSLINAHPDGQLTLKSTPLRSDNNKAVITAQATFLHYWRG
ncbi:sensor histidine kinase [Pseudoalteromonas obscura]|uniref:histidine kinase n=1 Tax=Pseudoalteromonas obscura TaxID=3048491 RepID=A0ABT7EDX0_9GAMM|nr:HAMP domain-containing sensor histidine kinase [Pseudoalteromonas sp. P94(2023)]MDK2593469.1 HAMP domain-containing sensor histidine kinase [Pseudoalteromonas sp. P94(2023)]